MPVGDLDALLDGPDSFSAREMPSQARLSSPPLEEVGEDLERPIGWNREIEARELGHAREDDADDSSRLVEQGAARIARIEGRVDLHDVAGLE